MQRGRMLLGFSIGLMAFVQPVRGDDWKLVGNEHGIEIYSREVPDSRIVALKGRGAVDAPVWKVASVLLDVKRAPEWVDSLKEAHIVRRLTPTSYIEYNHLGLPLIIKDRDFVSEVQVEVNEADRSVALVYKPTDDSGGVVARNRVRGQVLAGAFRARSLESGRRTELTAEIHCDPKGAIPAWLVNVFQKSWPRQTFEGIRKQVAKPDVGIPDEFRELLARARDF